MKRVENIVALFALLKEMRGEGIFTNALAIFSPLKNSHFWRKGRQRLEGRVPCFPSLLSKLFPSTSLQLVPKIRENYTILS